MAEKNESAGGILIGVFIALIIGTVLLGTSASQVNDITSLQSTTDAAQTFTWVNTTFGIDETAVYTLTNAPTGWKAQSVADGGCIITDYSFVNSTGYVFEDAVDYTIDTAAGTYTLGNTTAIRATDDNATIATYSYCPDGYQTGFGKTTLNLVPGFFALAILLSAVFLIFVFLRRAGIVA